jgi:hypothetical protein
MMSACPERGTKGFRVKDVPVCAVVCERDATRLVKGLLSIYFTTEGDISIGSYWIGIVKVKSELMGW